MNKASKKALKWVGIVVVLGVILLLIGGTPDQEPLTTSADTEVEVAKVEAEAQSQAYTEKEAVKKEFRELVTMIRNNEPQVKVILENNAIEDWTENGMTDWEMVEYVYNGQVEAFEEFLDVINHRDFKGSLDEEILMTAVVTWAYDYEMIMYTYEQQLESYNNMN